MMAGLPRFESSGPDRPGAQTGFTLVEVMVALTILSLIMLATVTGLRTLANTQVAIERMTSRVDEVRTVSGFLRDAMQSSVIGASRSRLSLGGGGRAEAAFFEATPQSLAWKSTVLFGEGFGGSYLVRVAKEEGQLVLRWQEPPLKGRPGDWQKAASRTLVYNLEELKLSFRKDFSAAWTNTLERNEIPSLVRLQLRASGRYWPDLILRVQKEGG
jgi:general secretion pathway protein J